MNRLLKTVGRLVAGVAVAVLLSSCGGGDPVVAFAPKRLLAFGDELSVLESDGRKFSVNQLDSVDTTKLVCASNPLWIQRLATYYALVLNECNGNGVTDSPSRIYAAVGAKVSDLTAQVQAHIDAGTGFSGTDLVTMMIGQNDVIEQYGAYAAAPSDAALAAAQATLQARGAAFAAQVSRVASLGGKVLAATPVDISYSPWARALGTTQRQVIQTMLQSFITGFREGIQYESGTHVARILANETTQLMARSADEGFGATYGLSNSKDAVCLNTIASLDQCTNLTLVDADNNPSTTTSASTYLWADATRIGPTGHTYLGALAINRATGNPF